MLVIALAMSSVDNTTKLKKKHNANNLTHPCTFWPQNDVNPFKSTEVDLATNFISLGPLLKFNLTCRLTDCNFLSYIATFAFYPWLYKIHISSLLLKNGNHLVH
jgi:hypothetical protein